MPRPCVCGNCRLCWLAENDPRYQDLWGVYPQTTCIYRGDYTGEKTICKSCKGKVQIKLRSCEIHGKCSEKTTLPNIQCCKGCEDAVTNPYTGTIVRNLLFHLYPVRGGEWEWNMDQIQQRISNFNGKKLLIIATDGSTDPPSKVDVKGFDEVHHFPNNPKLREVVGLSYLFQKVITFDPNHITFWGHSKGVIRRGQSHVRKWAEMLYSANLDDLKAVQKGLQNKIFMGAFKKNGVMFEGSQSRWHYSGGMYWFRNCLLFRRNWRIIDNNWWGSESYPGLHSAVNESGCLFHEENGDVLNMYDPKYVDDRYGEYQKKVRLSYNKE